MKELEIKTPYIDRIFFLLASKNGTRLEDVRKVLDGVPYLRVYRRLEHLASLGKIRVERGSQGLTYFVHEVEKKENGEVAASPLRNNPTNESQRISG